MPAVRNKLPFPEKINFLIRSFVTRTVDDKTVNYVLANPYTVKNKNGLANDLASFKREYDRKRLATNVGENSQGIETYVEPYVAEAEPQQINEAYLFFDKYATYAAVPVKLKTLTSEEINETFVAIKVNDSVFKELVNLCDIKKGGHIIGEDILVWAAPSQYQLNSLGLVVKNSELYNTLVQLNDKLIDQEENYRYLTKGQIFGGRFYKNEINNEVIYAIGFVKESGYKKLCYIQRSNYDEDNKKFFSSYKTRTKKENIEALLELITENKRGYRSWYVRTTSTPLLTKELDCLFGHEDQEYLDIFKKGGSMVKNIVGSQKKCR